METTTQEAMSEVVAAAYVAFQGAAPDDLGVCLACCMPVDLHNEILRKPARDITTRQLEEWLNAAAQDPMPYAICRFFLPRVLAALAQDEDLNTVGLEVLLQRFKPYLCEGLTDPQHKVVERFVALWVPHYVVSGRDNLDDALCMLVLGGWDMAVLKPLVLGLSDQALITRLWRDWCPPRGHHGVWHTAFWPKGQNGDALYTAPELLVRIEAYVLADETGERDIEKACAVWDVLHAHAGS